MMGKRFALAILSAVMAIGFAGCSSSAQNPKAAEPPSDSNPPEPGVYNAINGEEGQIEKHSLNPPEATPVAIHKVIGDGFAPDEFVTGVTGRTPVTVGFYTQPHDRLEGEQEVLILLTDMEGNTAVVTSLLTLIRDTEPPVITGALHKTIFLGDTIAYRMGISVTDNLDAEVRLTVDSSAVEPRKEGIYEVIYSATDSSGNTTTVHGSVTVHSVTREQVDEMADEVLEGILTEDMTPYKKTLEIYLWVQEKMNYGSSTVKDSVTYAAYRGFKDGYGDCYVYYAVTEVLLTCAGIENIPVERIPGQPAMHYWSLVDIGDGWYHLDTTPHESGGSGFMLTESEAQALTVNRSSTYYTYEKSLYPEVMP